MTSEQCSTARHLYVWRGHSISRIAEALGLEIADVALFIDPDIDEPIKPPPRQIQKRRGVRGPDKKQRVRRVSKPDDILDGVVAEVIAERATRSTKARG